jgi:hypothetical protein
MKEIKQKLTRYSSAVGALLAVTAGVQANPHLGTITGSDGNNFLDHMLDQVYLDVDNDGINDFLGVMFATSFSTTSTYNSNTYTYTYLYKVALFGSAYNATNDAEESVELNGTSDLSIKKFFLNDRIGPLSNPYYYGVISEYSNWYSSGPASPPAMGVPFINGDAGYIGLQMDISPAERHYGWAQILIDGDGNVDFIACALENRNQIPILAGNNIPVPLLPIASAAGLGLVGLMAAMKRRKRNVTV